MHTKFSRWLYKIGFLLDDDFNTFKEAKYAIEDLYLESHNQFWKYCKKVILEL